MIVLGKDKIDTRFNIDDNGTITALDGTVQETKKDGYEFFHKQRVHSILMWTKFGYRDTKIWDIHHLDENKLNNNINNLVFLTHSKHTSLHFKNVKKGNLSEEHKKKLSEAHKGKKHSKETKKKISESHIGMKGKHHSEETKIKLSKAIKGKNWKKDPITGKRIWY